MKIDWLSLIIGAVSSWLITKIYYEKAKTDSDMNAKKKNINDEKKHQEIIEKLEEWEEEK